jgi:hypothetical protein
MSPPVLTNFDALSQFLSFLHLDLKLVFSKWQELLNDIFIAYSNSDYIRQTEETTYVGSGKDGQTNRRGASSDLNRS